uniref:Putative ovule protein n=1 Tax=Solanum chacoense TaxID=4108 RepID=A0A0V0H9Z5_SOLCH
MFAPMNHPMTFNRLSWTPTKLFAKKSPDARITQNPWMNRHKNQKIPISYYRFHFNSKKSTYSHLNQPTPFNRSSRMPKKNSAKRSPGEHINKI